jgi:hypothetical protein
MKDNTIKSALSHACFATIGKGKDRGTLTFMLAIIENIELLERMIRQNKPAANIVN